MTTSGRKMSPEQLTVGMLRLIGDDPDLLAELSQEVLPVDLIPALHEMDAADGARLVARMPFRFAVDLFDEPTFERRHDIFPLLPDGIAIPILEAMSSDQQAGLLRETEAREKERLLGLLGPETGTYLRRILGFPERTAGAIMTMEFVSVPAAWTASEALAYIQEVGQAKETVYAIYVTDEDGVLIHVVSLRDLVLSDRSRTMRNIGPRKKPVVVRADTESAQVAHKIAKYDLLAVPVTDENGHVLGIVTVDDVIDVLIEEETEDAHKLGGLSALDEPYLEVGMGRMLKKRGGWLAALFLGETLTATAMAFFEVQIEQAVVLALFIPLVISSGGNSGSQATTLVIRAMALGQVVLRDWWRVIRREFAAGLFLGVLLATIGFTRIILWHAVSEKTRGVLLYGEHVVLVATTLAVSLIGIVTWGTVVGATLPFILRRLGFDPASASAPFVATLVDVTGIIIYFSVAIVLLKGTLL